MDKMNEVTTSVTATSNAASVIPNTSVPAPAVPLPQQMAPIPPFERGVQGLFASLQNVASAVLGKNLESSKNYKGFQAFMKHYPGHLGEHQVLYAKYWNKSSAMILSDNESWLVDDDVKLVPETDKHAFLALSDLYSCARDLGPPLGPKYCKEIRQHLALIFLSFLEATDPRVQQLAKISPMVPQAVGGDMGNVINTFFNVVFKVAKSVDIDKIVTEKDPVKIITSVADDLEKSDLGIKISQEQKAGVTALLMDLNGKIETAKQKKKADKAADGKSSTPDEDIIKF